MTGAACTLLASRDLLPRDGCALAGEAPTVCPLEIFQKIVAGKLTHSAKN